MLEVQQSSAGMTPRTSAFTMLQTCLAGCWEGNRYLAKLQRFFNDTYKKGEE